MQRKKMAEKSPVCQKKVGKLNNGTAKVCCQSIFRISPFQSEFSI
jgi:hypothetical protein